MSDTSKNLFCNDSTEAERRVSRQFLVANIVWAAALLACAWVAKFVQVESFVLQLAVAAIPILIGMVSFSLFIKMLRVMDELQRRIQLEALAIGFAVGVLYEIGFTLYTRLADLQNASSSLASVMLFTWMGAVLWGKWRYK